MMCVYVLYQITSQMDSADLWQYTSRQCMPLLVPAVSILDSFEPVLEAITLLINTKLNST